MKRMIRRVAGMFLGLIFCLQWTAAQPLPVGASIPDIELTGVLNHTSTKLKLSDWKGQLVILDFWSSTCASCIHEFPRTDSLQKMFGGKVQFLLVTRETKEDVLRFFEKRKKIRVPSVPLVTGDTVLSRFFPYVFVPHHVWINPEGRVHAITYADNASAGQIRRFLEGQQGDMAVKKDSILNVASTGPLGLAQVALAQDKLEYFSFISRYMEGTHGGASVGSTGGSDWPNAVIAESESVLTLYKIAFGEHGKRPFLQHSNTVILDLQEPAAYLPPSDINQYEIWKKEHKYAYQLRVPPSHAERLFPIMQQDLVQYFGLQARIEKRKVRCWVLVRTGKKDKLQTKGGAMRTNFFTNTSDSVKYMYNFPFQSFVKLLDMRWEGEASPGPLRDETGYNQNVDIALNAADWMDWNITNLQPLRKALQAYNLDIREATRKMDVLVISDKPE